MHVTRDVMLDVDLATAWELVADPEELSAWLGTVGDVPLRPGGAATVLDPDGTVRHLVVEHVEDGRALGFVWWADGDEFASRVAITIEEHDGASRVVVTESAVARASIAGATSRLRLGSAWDGRLLDLELRSLSRTLVAV